MREVGRNDPCPCGSGHKHKRCCLEIERVALRVATAAEERILELGQRLREEVPAEWRAAYECNLTPLNRWGTVPAEMAAWLDTWLICDEPLVDGRIALEAFAEPESADADAWLRASSICGWWLRGSEFPLPATHWRYEEPLTLHCPREPLGTSHEGALLIARGVDIGAGHVALAGRPIVVDEEAVSDVLAVLVETPAASLCAALRWPEVREHTAQGELVQPCYRSYALDDPDSAVAVLRASPGVIEQDDAGTYWEDDVMFEIRGPLVTDAVEPAAERGIVWELCREDRADPPVLGEVTVSRDDGELSMTALTSNRTEQLFEALPADVRSALGELVSEDLDGPDVLPRVSRERLEQLMPMR